MLPHHQETIANAERFFAADPDVLALLVGGSLAHGYARPNSDIDIVIIITPEAYARRQAAQEVLYLNFDLCTYEGGYLDGKYLDLAFLERVAERGSEAARYAFKDAITVFCRDDRIPSLLERATRYPLERQEANIHRFLAQMNAWKWMTAEGRKHGNPYLIQRGATNFVLFCTRVILAHNALLYPFHKWMLRELERAPERPADMLAQINAILADPTAATMDRLFEDVKAITSVPFDDATWGTWFLRDSEQNWLDHEPPVADL